MNQSEYFNPLIVAVGPALAILFSVTLSVPLFVPAIRDLPPGPWAVVLTCLLVLALGSSFVTTMFLRWRVSPAVIQVRQPGRYGAAITRTFANQDFLSLMCLGPIVIVRCVSGKRYVWPRWLRSKGKTYRWELSNMQLRLVV